MNLFVRGTAEIVGLLLSLISTVWVSRAVGPTLFGYYAVALTIITLGTLGINAGLSMAGAQRAANDPDQSGEIWWAVVAGRLVIAVPAVIIGIVILMAMPIAPVLGGFLVVGFLSWVVVPFRTEWLLIAHGRLAAISAARVLGSVASVLVAVLFVRDPADAWRLPFVAVASATASAAVTMFVAWRSWPLRRPKEQSRRAVIGAYLADGFHYLKSDAAIFIFTSSDRIFLYVFASPAVVGLYEAAYRVIQPFYTISTVVGDTMYVQLARAFATDRLNATFRRYVDLMCLVTIPLGFFLLAFAPAVISLLYGSEVQRGERVSRHPWVGDYLRIHLRHRRPSVYGVEPSPRVRQLHCPWWASEPRSELRAHPVIRRSWSCVGNRRRQSCCDVGRDSIFQAGNEVSAPS